MINIGKDGIGAVSSSGQGSLWRVEALKGRSPDGKTGVDPKDLSLVGKQLGFRAEMLIEDTHTSIELFRQVGLAWLGLAFALALARFGLCCAGLIRTEHDCLHASCVFAYTVAEDGGGLFQRSRSFLERNVNQRVSFCFVLFMLKARYLQRDAFWSPLAPGVLGFVCIYGDWLPWACRCPTSEMR